MDKPVVAVPAGDKPAELQIFDDQVGDGPEATAGSRVGALRRRRLVDRRAVRRLVGSRRTLDFGLGAGQVIEGWDTGVQGMKVGGRRTLIIPPHQAYGSRGAPGAIAPNETLIFTVDLMDVR